VLAYYGVTASYGFYVGVLVAYLAVVHCITYLALWRGSRRLTARR
jgi:hypothetical protein